MRSLSDERLLPVASFLAKQRGLHPTEVTRRQQEILMDAAESALREIDAKWDHFDE